MPVSADATLPTPFALPRFELCPADSPPGGPHLLGCLNFVAPGAAGWARRQPAEVAAAPALQVPLKGHTGLTNAADLTALDAGTLSPGPRLPEAGTPCVQLRVTSPVLPRSGETGGVVWRETADWLFGSLHIPLSATTSCEAAVREGYAALLALAEAHGKPHWVRIWNYVPRITAPDATGQEVYRSFNVGRAQALDAAQFHTRELPAATGIGIEGDHIAVAFLASTAAGRHIENPRQVAAYHYPSEHSPRPPAFARATAWPRNSAPQWLLISGTASIIGHQTVHRDDVMAQARTALGNVALLLAQRSADLAHLRDVVLYVRHARDVAPVARWLGRQLPSQARVLVTQADICRPDLLVELEGMALLD